MFIYIVTISLVLSLVGLGYWSITLYSKINTLKIDLAEAWRQRDIVQQRNIQILKDLRETKAGNIWFNKFSQYRLAYDNLHQSATKLVASLPDHEQRYLGLYTELKKKF